MVPNDALDLGRVCRWVPRRRRGFWCRELCNSYIRSCIAAFLKRAPPVLMADGENRVLKGSERLTPVRTCATLLHRVHGFKD